MATLRPVSPLLLWSLQWLLAAAFYLLGLLKATLPIGDLERLHLLADPDPLLGLVEIAGGMALVIPSATGFLARLTPLSAALLAAISAAGAIGGGTAAGLGVPLVDGALMLGCLGVAVGRGILLPVAPYHPRPAPPDRLRPLPGRERAPTGASLALVRETEVPSLGPGGPMVAPRGTWPPQLDQDGADAWPGD